jgi:hypothetical protein
MITTALIVAGAILSVVAVVVFILSLANAPEGIEDEAGFHHVKQAGKEAGRYYSAKSLAKRPAKTAHPLKAHSPAA